MERDEYYSKIQAYKSKKLEHASNGLKGQMRDNHTYYKREGQPGNYRYYYSKEEYDAAHNHSFMRDPNGKDNKEIRDEQRNENRIATQSSREAAMKAGQTSTMNATANNAEAIKKQLQESYEKNKAAAEAMHAAELKRYEEIRKANDIAGFKAKKKQIDEEYFNRSEELAEKYIYGPADGDKEKEIENANMLVDAIYGVYTIQNKLNPGYFPDDMKVEYRTDSKGNKNISITSNKYAEEKKKLNDEYNKIIAEQNKVWDEIEKRNNYESSHFFEKSPEEWAQYSKETEKYYDEWERLNKEAFNKNDEVLFLNSKENLAAREYLLMLTNFLK